jgi:hypothetical protein
MRTEIVQHSTPIDQNAQRTAISGPNTRWMLPEQQPPAQLLAPMQQGAIVTVDPAFTSHENSGSEEYATPGSRAVGQLIRLLPFTIVWALLVWGMVWLLQLSAPYFLFGFAVLTAATYWKMNRDEFDYSRNGLERHKVDSALEVRLTQMEYDQQLKSKSLDAYLKIALNHYGVQDNDPTR